MTRIAIATVFVTVLASGLVTGLGDNTAAPARAGGGDAFARALAAYDAGRHGDAAGTWARLAANGDRDATAALAGLYRQGLGVPRDAARAAALYRRAGLSGHVIAQTNLGEMLAQGEGIKRDGAGAWAWFRLAADGGNAWAEGQAKAICNGLTAEARGRAMSARTRIERERVARP
jgi:TPR repeat protein